jgi:hypothetical protein
LYVEWIIKRFINPHKESVPHKMLLPNPDTSTGMAYSEKLEKMRIVSEVKQRLDAGDKAGALEYLKGNVHESERSRLEAVFVWLGGMHIATHIEQYRFPESQTNRTSRDSFYARKNSVHFPERVPSAMGEMPED